LVTRATNLAPSGLLNWWTEAVIKGLMRKGNWADPRPGYVTHREGTIQRAGVPRTEPLHAVLRLCPSWPAITSGGCREFHHAGMFIRQHYDLLRYAGIETVWNPRTFLKRKWNSQKSFDSKRLFLKVFLRPILLGLKTVDGLGGSKH
jgi:hypothetical protein